MAFFGGVKIVGHRIVDHPDTICPSRSSPMEMAKMGNAVHEVGGAVDRIDDEAVGSVGAGDRAAFLAQKAVTGRALLSSSIRIFSVRLSAL